MPWKVFSEDGKSKVYKVDDEGKKVGSPLGTHSDPKKADAQVRALYASEKKPKKELDVPGLPEHSDREITFYPVKVVPDEEEIARRAEAKEAKNYGEEMAMPMMGGPCSWDEYDAMEQAEEINEELYEMNDKMGMMARNVMTNPMIEDKAAALADLAKGYAERMTKMTTEPAEKSVNDIVKQIAGDNQPGHANTDKDAPGGDSDDQTTTKTQDLFIWKEGDTYRWIAAYSNNRRDSDSPPEIISTESHKEFDEALQKGEWPMPEAWLWHVPYPVGVADYHAFDESTGFPVAAGHFYKGMEWAAEGVMQANWDGVSHGMPSEWIERDKGDGSIIIRHRTKEITFLPLWAAANKLAFSIINKEQIMADEKGLPAHKREEFIKAFGEERVEQIEMTLADKAKEADEAGIEKKEAETAETPAETLTPESPVVKALEMVVAQLAALDTRLKTIEDKQVEAVEEKEQPFDLMEFLKSKSAIGQPTTKVDGRSKEAKDAPEEAKQESWTERASGIRVSLVDELVGANQAYYQEYPTNGR